MFAKIMCSLLAKNIDIDSLFLHVLMNIEFTTIYVGTNGMHT